MTTGSKKSLSATSIFPFLSQPRTFKLVSCRMIFRPLTIRAFLSSSSSSEQQKHKHMHITYTKTTSASTSLLTAGVDEMLEEVECCQADLFLSWLQLLQEERHHSVGVTLSCIQETQPHLTTRVLITPYQTINLLSTAKQRRISLWFLMETALPGDTGMHA